MNTPNNDALILDIRIADLKERGDKLIHRERFLTQSEEDAKAYKKLWNQRQRLVQARWDMIPPKLRAWCAEKANATNSVMKAWREENKMKGVAE